MFRVVALKGRGMAASNESSKSIQRSGHLVRIARVIEETADAKSFVFDLPAEIAAKFSYRAGQFVSLNLTYNGESLRRCYSLASCPVTERAPKITVKRVADGRASNWLNDNLREGAWVEVLPPEGRFVLRESSARLVFFAGGSGITPILSIIKNALACTERKARLVYANRNRQSVIFRRELDALCEQHQGRLEVVYRYDEDDGFLRASDITRYRCAEAAEYYLCGPGPFMAAIEAGLREAQVDESAIFIERFEQAAKSDSRADELDAQLPDVGGQTIPITYKGAHVDVPRLAGKSILEMAIAAGIDAPYSCEEGFCGCCIARLVRGEVQMSADDALTSDDKRRGLILTCQARPTSLEVEVDYDSAL